jgi:hypothetical protein
MATGFIEIYLPVPPSRELPTGDIGGNAFPPSDNRMCSALLGPVSAAGLLSSGLL